MFNVKKFVSQYHYDARNFEWEKKMASLKQKVDVNFQLINRDQEQNTTSLIVILSYMIVFWWFVISGTILNQPLVWSLCQWTKWIQQRRSGRIAFAHLLGISQTVWLTKSQELPLIYQVLIWVLINEISGDLADSSAYLTQDVLHPRRLIYFKSIYIDGRSYVEGRTWHTMEFYQKMAASKNLLKTMWVLQS